MLSLDVQQREQLIQTAIQGLPLTLAYPFALTFTRSRIARLLTLHQIPRGCSVVVQGWNRDRGMRRRECKLKYISI